MGLESYRDNMQARHEELLRMVEDFEISDRRDKVVVAVMAVLFVSAMGGFGYYEIVAHDASGGVDIVGK